MIAFKFQIKIIMQNTIQIKIKLLI